MSCVQGAMLWMKLWPGDRALKFAMGFRVLNAGARPLNVTFGSAASLFLLRAQELKQICH